MKARVAELESGAGASVVAESSQVVEESSSQIVEPVSEPVSTLDKSLPTLGYWNIRGLAQHIRF